MIEGVGTSTMRDWLKRHRPAAAAVAGFAAYLLIARTVVEGLRPVAAAVAAAMVAGAVVGLVLTGNSRRWLPTSLSILVAGAGYSVAALFARVALQALPLLLAVTSAAAAGLIVSAVGSLDLRLAEALALVAVLAASAILAGVIPAAFNAGPIEARRNVLSETPLPETYSVDSADFLVTYGMMKRGEGYYQAFKQGFVWDTRRIAADLTSPLNYREPLVFEIWRILPGSKPLDLLNWFFVWIGLTMIAAYALSSALTEPGFALLAPIALIRFGAFFWWNIWFPGTEVWAAVFVVAAVALLVRKQRSASVVALTAAVAAREFAVLLIPAWIVVWWMSGPTGRRRGVWFPIAAVAGPAFVLALHLLSVPALSPGGPGVGNWFHGGISRLLAALRFGWAPLGPDGMPAAAWLPLVIAAAAIGSAALARPRWKAAALLVVTVLPTVFLLVLSGGVWHYYWGAFYTPLAAAIAPGVLGRLFPPAPPPTTAPTSS